MAMTPGEPAGLGELVLRKRREMGARAKALPAWTPQPGPQTEFYESTADEVLYGGAAGPGKSSAAVALPLRWAHHPAYRALVLRRETPQLEDLFDKARSIYQRGQPDGARPYRAADPGAEFNSVKGTWTFKSGARVRFNHCQRDDDAYNYQGHEYQTIIFDELTHFTEKQYLEVKSRNRSGIPEIPTYVRSTTNPGGPGHEWVFKRWGPWLDPDYKLEDWEIVDVLPDGTTALVRGSGLPPRIDGGRKLPPARGGQVLYVARVGDREMFSTRPFLIGGEEATTRTFIPARLSDNPALLASDPKYRAKLRDNDPVRRRQLEDGDWLVRPAAGLYFKRAWFEIVDEAPTDCVWVRAWDKASTEPHPGNRDPDWTRGVLLGKSGDGYYYVGHVAGMRGGPGSVTRFMRQTAEDDGVEVTIRVPQDPGSAGVQASTADVRALEGFAVKAVRVTGSKLDRARPVSSQADPQSTGERHGRFRVVRGDWNEAFFSELENFDGDKNNGDHDDQVDGLSDGYDELKDIDLEEDHKPIKAGRRRW